MQNSEDSSRHRTTVIAGVRAKNTATIKDAKIIMKVNGSTSRDVLAVDANDVDISGDTKIEMVETSREPRREDNHSAGIYKNSN